MTVCILGNNLTALTLAKALINCEIDVDILHSKKIYKISDTRTIGITKNNIDFFNSNIINIEKLTWRLKKIEIFSETLNNEKLINFETGKDQLFSIVRNCKLLRLLEKDLSKNKYFKSIFLNDKNLSFIKKYELIINCEVFNKISEKYFSKKIIKKYDSFAYTTIIEHEKILNDTAIQIFTKKGPLAFLPISNNETSVVYSVHNSSIEKNFKIEELIKRYNFKYKIKNIKKVDSFELQSLNLRSYYHNNILAFGDLLHRVHPLAGQGFNMTIRDIKNLTNIIIKKNELGLPIDSSICDEFEDIVKHKNLIFSSGVNLIHEFFNIERKSNSKILSKSIQYLGKNSSANRILTKIADKGILF